MRVIEEVKLSIFLHQPLIFSPFKLCYGSKVAYTIVGVAYARQNFSAKLPRILPRSNYEWAISAHLVQGYNVSFLCEIWLSPLFLSIAAAGEEEDIRYNRNWRNMGANWLIMLINPPRRLPFLLSSIAFSVTSINS